MIQRYEMKGDNRSSQMMEAHKGRRSIDSKTWICGRVRSKIDVVVKRIFTFNIKVLPEMHTRMEIAISTL